NGLWLMQVRSRACLLPCRQGLIRHGRSAPSSLDDVPSFVVVESAPDAVNGSGFECVFEAFGLDGAAAADLLGFGGFGSAVGEENVAVDTQAGGVVPPGGPGEQGTDLHVASPRCSATSYPQPHE